MSSREVFDVALDEIFCDEEFNSRSFITPASIIQLADSIKASGLQSPILIRPDPLKRKKYVIVFGHRRYKACAHIQLDTIAAFVEEMTDDQARLNNINENLQREDLTMAEEAQAVVDLGRIKGWTYRQIGEHLHKSEGWVQLRYVYFELPEEARDAYDCNLLTQPDLKELHTMFHGTRASDYTPEEVFEIIREIKTSRQNSQALTVKDVRSRKQAAKKKPLEYRPKTMTEIQEMQQIMWEANACEHDMSTRVLAWGMGGRTSNQLIQDVEKHYDYVLDDEVKKKFGL